jgi:hypothetical protein
MLENHENTLHTADSLNILSSPLLFDSTNPFQIQEDNLLGSNFESSAIADYIQSITSHQNDLRPTNIFGTIEYTDQSLSASDIESLDKSVFDAAIIVKDYLTNFFSKPDATEEMSLAFGNNFNEEKLTNFIQSVVNGNPTTSPNIIIVSDDTLKGRNGGFDEVTGSIYLSDSFVNRNSNNPQALAEVLLEEYGHLIDPEINIIDSPGDEGEIFAMISQGKEIPDFTLEAIQNEDDTGIIYFENQIRNIEYSDNLSDLHKNIIDDANKVSVDENVNEWDEEDILRWKTPIVGNENYIYEFKEQWVSGYKDVIKAAADKFDIPSLLLAGVAYNEVGGDPLWIDDAAYATRTFDHLADPYLPTITKEPELTSFGNVSIQVRRAIETLGYESDSLDTEQEQMIIDSLKDPKQNIFIAAAHLADLRDIDFQGKSADQMGSEEIKLTATRYNRGPDLSLEDIKKDTSYGDVLMESNIAELLAEENLVA